MVVLVQVVFVPMVVVEGQMEHFEVVVVVSLVGEDLLVNCATNLVILLSTSTIA